MNRRYQLQQELATCPTHGPAQFEGRVWEGNLLQEVPGEALKIADVFGRGRLSCDCPVSIAWYATEGEPQIMPHTINHPELGLVLESQCGAQSDGCACDTPDRSEEAAPQWLQEILAENRRLWAAGQPGSIDAVLASDGWWWRVL